MTALAVCAVAAGCQRPPSPYPPSPSASPPSVSPPPSGATVRPGLVDLADVDPRILTDFRYATAHNFVGRPIAGYEEPLCLLTRPAAEALRRVQDVALEQGRSLKVYDCYRPQRAVDEFVAWGAQPGAQEMKAEFYPRVAKSDLFAEGYLGAPSAHSRGSTVDLTLVDVPAAPQPTYSPGQSLRPCTAPAQQRFPDNSVDMGTGFDCFDPLSATDNPRVDATARANRRLLEGLMTDAGFVNYDREWWHYRYRDEPWPDTYFDLPVARSSTGHRGGS
nr:M15 family metallopeptidase [Micromonospora nigra]